MNLAHENASLNILLDWAEGIRQDAEAESRDPSSPEWRSGLVAGKLDLCTEFIQLMRSLVQQNVTEQL